MTISPLSEALQIQGIRYRRYSDSRSDSPYTFVTYEIISFGKSFEEARKILEPAGFHQSSDYRFRKKNQKKHFKVYCPYCDKDYLVPVAVSLDESIKCPRCRK